MKPQGQLNGKNQHEKRENKKSVQHRLGIVILAHLLPQKMSEIPDVMRAAVYTHYDTNYENNFRYAADIPVPKNLESGQVLVKVKCAAINPGPLFYFILFFWQFV
jgi:hypothetical protein